MLGYGPGRDAYGAGQLPSIGGAFQQPGQDLKAVPVADYLQRHGQLYARVWGSRVAFPQEFVERTDAEKKFCLIVI